MRRPALCCAVAFALLDGASGGGRRALQQAGACGPQLAATQLRHTAATPSRQVFTDSADECCGLAAAEWQAWTWCRTDPKSQGRCALLTLSLSPAEAVALGQARRQSPNPACTSGFLHAKGAPSPAPAAAPAPPAQGGAECADLSPSCQRDVAAERIDCFDAAQYARCQASCVRRFGQPGIGSSRGRCRPPSSGWSYSHDAPSAAPPPPPNDEHIAAAQMYGPPPAPPKCDGDEDADCSRVIAVGVTCDTPLTELDPANLPNVTLAEACFLSCGRCRELAQRGSNRCRDVLHNCAAIFAMPGWPSPCLADASALHSALPSGTTLATLCPTFCDARCGDDSCADGANGVCDYRPQGGSINASCAGGTDRTDCAHSPCPHEDNGRCDAGSGACALGTDVADCGTCHASDADGRSIHRDVAGCVNTYDIIQGERGDGPAESRCEALVAGGFTCAANFCPTCRNPSFCDRSCGYCADPCRDAIDRAGEAPESEPAPSDEPAGAAPSLPGTDTARDVLPRLLAMVVLCVLVCCASFLIVARARLRLRLQALGGDEDDPDILTVNATFSGFLGESLLVEPRAADGPDDGGLIVVSAECAGADEGLSPVLVVEGAEG